MDLHHEDLPATLQAFDLVGTNEIFIAEQVVNTQAEIDNFTARYAGKLIKAKKVPVVVKNAIDSTSYKTNRTSTGILMFLLILIIVGLVIYGFSTGWIQEKLHLKI